MLPAFRRDVLGCLLETFRRYGDVVAYQFGPRRGPLARMAVGAYHPDDVHRVLTGTGHAVNRHTAGFELLGEMFGAGMLTGEGENWRRQRRTLQPLFSPRRVAGYAAQMADEAARTVADPAISSGNVIDLHQQMRCYTLRAVGRILLGGNAAGLADMLDRVVPRISAVTRARAGRPGSERPAQHNHGLLRLRAAQYTLVDRILARRRPARGDRGDDLVSRLRAARDPVTGRPLSTQEIRDQVLVFLVAGHETTASALTFTLHLLGRHPELQDQVAADPDLVRAALLEGMRLYPPAYLTERLTTTDSVIGGHAVRRGTMVLASPWVTHRHPAFWPDPERFDPMRFVGHADRPRYAYFPFGGGPRSCVGEHFATLEATVLLEAVLAAYRVEAVDPALDPRPFVTLRPAGPVPARFTPRR